MDDYLYRISNKEVQHKTSKVNLCPVIFSLLIPSNAGAKFYPWSSSGVQKAGTEQQQTTAICQATGKGKRNNDIINNLAFRLSASQKHFEFVVFTTHYCST